MNNARFYYPSRTCNALGRLGGGGGRLPVPWRILKINPLHSPWCFGQINPYKNYNVSLYSWNFFPQQNIYTLIGYFEVT